MRTIVLTNSISSWIQNDYPVYLNRKNRRKVSIADKEKSNLQKIVSAITGNAITINIGNKNSPNWVSRSTDIYIEYVEEIKNRLSMLHVLKPSEFGSQIGFFEGLIPRDEIDLPMRLNGTTDYGHFSDKIVYALCYKDIRDKVAPRFFKELNIRSCVYCNANYAITDTDGNAYYDLDHWKPKALYPYLSASFFNFQPSCSSCNRRKSDKDNDPVKGQVFFRLWDENRLRGADVFRFELSPLSLVKYLAFHDSKDLSISIQDAIGGHLGKMLCKTANDTFHINGRYHEHNDYLEEIIWKCQIYNGSGLAAFYKVLGGSIPKYVDPLRFIMGNYILPDDAHKRPLAKLTQDIAKQLRLIP